MYIYIIYIYIHKYGWLTNFFVSAIIFSKVSRKIDKSSDRLTLRFLEVKRTVF